MEKIKLNDNNLIPKLGLGTWYLGENPKTFVQEQKALNTGLQLGLSLIDTAEMYGYGDAEILVGKTIQDFKRQDLFLVSKILPTNATSAKMIKEHLEASLKRLNTDYLDLYLLHWRANNDLEMVVQTFEQLKKEGKIKAWGVSNFDVKDMQDLLAIEGGKNCVVNQVLYHLGSRGIEYELIPLLNQYDIKVMAYCPLAQAGSLKEEMLANKTLHDIANKYQISVIQLLLVFVLAQDNMIAIPRSSQSDHVIELYKASQIKLSQEDYKTLDKLYPAPNHKVALDIE